jgi:arsenical pump membrane protein
LSLPAAKKRFPVITLLILAAAGTALGLGHDSHGVVLVTLALSTIALIIFGERFAIDEALESRSIPGRDAFLPLIALSISVFLGAVSPATIPLVFSQKIDIICLILSFAIVSEGIARSGYFAFAANIIVAKCHGNTTRLILYLYILASILAYFTSNDIVILVLTPVLFSICVNARITNARLLLLAEFMAANTMAMGTMIGSPTNIIFGNALNMSYVDYLFMMVLPSLLCAVMGLVVIDWINRQSRPGSDGLFVKRWAFEDTYRVPAAARHSNFTPAMKTWLIVFSCDVVLLAVVSSFHRSLLWAAIPIAATAIYFLYSGMREDSDSPEKAAQDIRNILRSLPYSILFFGTTFFAFSYEISRLGFTQDVVLPFVKAHLLDDVVHASFGTILVTVGIVNSINDLPAAALLSDILKHLDAQGGFNEYLRFVVMQSIMVGLNIGCYVTPVGALAGLMWFNIIRREERKQMQRDSLQNAAKAALENAGMAAKAAAPKLLTPSRGDMILYGLLHFAFVTLVLGFLLPFFVHIVDMLVSSPNVANETSMPDLIAIRGRLPYIGIAVLGTVYMLARAAMLRSGVLLGHLREVFVVMTRITIWTMRNRMLYLAILGSVILSMASGVLFWAETTHERIFGTAEGSKALFDSLSSFFIWAMVFSGAGLSDAYKCHSALGMALTSIMPVLVIGGIVMIAQLSSEKTIKDLARRMAIGEIPGHRIVIVNFQGCFEKLVTTMLSNRSATVLLLCDQKDFDRASSFSARMDQNAWSACRTYAAVKHADAAYTIQEYGIETADEIYLLSDGTQAGEYDKIRYLARLDSAFNDILKAMTEGLEAALREGAISQEQVGGISDLRGIPKIFVETLSERYNGIMQKASSPLFLNSTVNTMFDGDIADLLMSDIDASLDSLNRYYRLGAPPPPHLFRDGKSPLSRYVLRGFALDDEGRALFRAHFAGPQGPEGSRDAVAAAFNPTLVRLTVGENTRGSGYLDGKERKPVDPAALFGIGTDIAGTHVLLSTSAAALSMQPVAVDRVVLKRPAGESAGRAAGVPDSGYRVFVFNLSPTAQVFVRQMLRLFEGEKHPRIVLLCASADGVPEDIRNSTAVHLLPSPEASEMARLICPRLAEWKDAKDKGFSPLLRKGDRLYGFYESANSEESTRAVDFIDQLDTRLQQLALDAAAEGVETPVSHPDVYIAMGVEGVESRLMLRNFFIDKLIDISIPRISYLETIAKIFHRAMSEKTLAADVQDTVFNFRRAAEIAAYLCHYTVEFAEDMRLRDDSGTEIRVLGKSLAEAAAETRAYSMPPMQLFARVRVASEPRGVSRHSGRSFCLVEVDEQEPIARGDLLIYMPKI